MADIGLGCSLKYAATSVTSAAGFTTSAATSVTYLRSLTPPVADAEDLDVTTLDSSGSAAEYTAGLIDNGEVGFRRLYDQTVSNTLRGLAGTTYSWLLSLPAGTMYFQGYINRPTIPEITPGGLVEEEYSLKVSGGVTFATSA